MTLNIKDPCKDPAVAQFKEEIIADEVRFYLGMDQQSIQVTWPEELDLDQASLL